MRSLPLILAGAGIAFGAAASAQDIAFTGGGSDLTFFYNSTTDSFDTVFRAKTSTQATGLTDPYGQPPGGVGGGNPAGTLNNNNVDFNFDTLTVVAADPDFRLLNGAGYLSIGPAGRAAPGRPDLGIRTRFRETGADGNVDQFSSFQFTLDWENSIKPTGADFALWSVDGFGATTVHMETASDDFTWDYPIFGHAHFIFGFSEGGEYDLKFDLQGFGGLGDSGVGSVNVAFNMIPEPATLGVLGVAGMGLLMRRRPRRA